ncbi:MAG TPA: sigma factor-like helix-turn-helix DNA-binding protein, partial [Thermomonas sp.]|nr:sigma factor-like helix-turn-helix DNA-binding protein [Thermomonas sp.]
LYLDERPQREIADILGISESNVSTKIGRLKQRIQQTL